MSRQREVSERIAKLDYLYRFLGLSISNLCRDGRKAKYVDAADKVFEDVFGADRLASQLSMTRNIRTLRNIMRVLPVDDLFDCIDNPASYVVLKGMIQTAHAISVAERSLEDVTDQEINNNKDYASLRNSYRKLRKQYKQGVERFKKTYNIEDMGVSATKAFKAFAKGEFYGYNGNGSFSFFDSPYDPYDEYDDSPFNGSRFEDFCKTMDLEAAYDGRPVRRKSRNVPKYQNSHIYQYEEDDDPIDDDSESLSDSIKSIQDSLNKLNQRMSFKAPTKEHDHSHCTCEGGHSPSNNKADVARLDEQSQKIDKIINTIGDMRDVQDALIDRYETIAKIIEDNFDDDGNVSNPPTPAPDDDDDEDGITNDFIKSVIANANSTPVTPEEIAITREINERLYGHPFAPNVEPQNVTPSPQTQKMPQTAMNTSDFEPIPTVFEDESDVIPNGSGTKFHYNNGTK